MKSAMVVRLNEIVEEVQAVTSVEQERGPGCRVLLMGSARNIFRCRFRVPDTGPRMRDFVAAVGEPISRHTAVGDVLSMWVVVDGRGKQGQSGEAGEWKP